MENGFVRALRYFVRQAELYVLCIVVGSFAMAAYIWIIRGDGSSFAKMLQTVPSLDLWLSVVVLFTIGVSSYEYCYSTPVAFGCLRKNAFFGTMVMDVLIMLEGIGFYFLTAAWFDTGAKITQAVWIFAVFLLLESAARTMGMVAMRWGKIAYAIMIVIIVIASVSFGLLAGISELLGVMHLAGSYFGEGVVRHGKWILLAAAAAVSIAVNAVSWRVLKGFEVRA